MKKSIYSALVLLASSCLLAACGNSTSQESPASSTSTVSSTSSSAQLSSSSSSSSTETSLATTVDSGIKLESGQDTLNYTSMVLGDKDWQVIEDNYNRTNSIPSSLVQGNDGSLYRVYQDGVIKDMDDELVHQP